MPLLFKAAERFLLIPIPIFGTHRAARKPARKNTFKKGATGTVSIQDTGIDNGTHQRGTALCRLNEALAMGLTKYRHIVQLIFVRFTACQTQSSERDGAGDDFLRASFFGGLP